MGKLVSGVIGLQLMIVASFSSSATYQLQNYSVGPGGTNSTGSSTYKAQATAGEQANGSTSSATYKAGNGSIQTEQLNIPPAPTLSNGSGLYYNQLNCIVNTGGNPGDTNFAIAINTVNSFTSPNYVQADGTIGATAVYQTYTAWGGSGGFQIIGLVPSTTYYVEASAKQGMFTNTELSTTANSATTASPTLSFSVTPNSSSLGSFLPNTVTTSANISFTYSTNGASGGSIYVIGKNGGFYSVSQSYIIPSASVNLATQPEGFGIQATNPSQTSGGPLTITSPFNGTGNNVGADTTSFAQMFNSIAPISGATASANVQVKAGPSAPAVGDYSETFTFAASAGF